VDGSEVDGPDPVGDLLEGDVRTPEGARHEDLSAVPADGGVLGDSSNLEVDWVAEGSGCSGKDLGDGR
jgi:hypothetical protein